MNFQKTVDWLYTQLPVYQRDGFFKYKIDLSSIKSFCNYLKNPQNSFKSIHVAGTNGKGSSSHMLASIFQETNLNVGEPTCSSILRAFAKPCVNVVLPVPRLPVKDIILPILIFFARTPAICCVSLTELDKYSTTFLNS